MPGSPPVVLSIAGFDPSSGAGITADIKTIAAHGCYGVTAITSLTIQSTLGVQRTVPVDPEFLTDSLEELKRDVKVSAVHIGLLGNAEVANRVAAFLQESSMPNVVLDPVIRSSSGAALLDPGGLEILVRKLLPLADVVTPNLDEVAALTGLPPTSLPEMNVAARKLHEMGAKAVVVTGGHLTRPVDLLSVKGEAMQVFGADRVQSSNTHGTGCAFSTAVACHLALGNNLSFAVLLAKAYVLQAIRTGYSIGRGVGPVNHMCRFT